MADATLSSYDPVLKELYPQTTIENLVYQGAPLLAMLSKDEDFFGDNMVIATQFGNPQGRSATFATAQTNAQPSSQRKFNVTRVSDYSVATLTNELIEASANNKGAIIAALKNEMDTALQQLGRSWHHALYNNSGGAIGQGDSAYAVAGLVATLAETEDVANFEVNQEVAFSATDGTSGAIRAGTATITAVNRDTGVITTDADWDTQITSPVNSDFIFVAGDFGLKVMGLLGWVPVTAPSGGDSHFGVDRSVDVTRLAGVRFDGSALSIEEALIQGATRIARQGRLAQPDYCFMNTRDFGNLIVALGSKREYYTEKVGDVGFDGVLLHTPAGTIKVFPDFQCPRTRTFMLTMRNWRWRGLGKSPRIIDSDGLKVLRQSTSDGVEFRAVYRGNLTCTAPGYSGIITLPS